MGYMKLPRKNKRREADLDGPVLDWFQKNHPRSVIVEVKMQNGGKVIEHQQKLIDKVAKTGKFVYKFPDMGRRTPLDGISLKDIDVALCWMNDDRTGVCIINNEYDIDIKV
jgi:hypothetical protein